MEIKARPKNILSATSAQIFRCLWFMGVHSLSFECFKIISWKRSSIKMMIMHFQKEFQAIVVHIDNTNNFNDGLRIPGEEITSTAQLKIHSHSQIVRNSRNIFCLPHRPKWSDFFDICLHWVSLVRVSPYARSRSLLF